MAISGEDFIRELLNMNETFFRCFYAPVNLCEIQVTLVMVGRTQFALLRERLDPANDSSRIEARQHSTMIMAMPSVTSTAPASVYTVPTPPTTSPGSGDPGTRVAMSTLSEEAGIVATLGGASPGFQTYDATGLLNAVAQAATPAPPQDTSDTAAPADTPVSTAVSGDWGTILKSDPGLTSTAVADAVAQGIVNTIDVYA